MLKGTRIMMNEEARLYSDALNKLRGFLHQF